LVLCYHAVGDVTAGAFVSVAQLDRQLGLLVAEGYRRSTFSEAVFGPHDDRVLAVTFDDGHESVLAEGLPVLQRHALIGTVFPRLDLLGTEGSLTLEGLQALAAAGWEVGSHTLTHQDLSVLPDDELDRELQGSKEELESLLGLPCRSIAHPGGIVDRRVIAAAEAAGYEAGAALYGVSAPYGKLAWPRVGVDGGEGILLFRVRVSRPFRALRRSKRGTRFASRVAGMTQALGVRLGRHT
jgi:peptidoglycan/xylan/chitin deacetylase (PgdA/CDA1 family)